MPKPQPRKKPARKASRAPKAAPAPKATLVPRTADVAGRSPVAARRRRAALAPAQATALGRFIEAAYTMYADNPGDLTPPASADFPAGYAPIGGVAMRDFVFASTDPVFYGFVAQATAPPHDLVVALRGTQGGVEWWDDLNSAFMVKFRVPGCGYVALGFDRIYDTIEIVPYPTAADGGAAPAERSLAAKGGLARQIAALVESRRRALPAAAPAPVVSVTGHSLGAALATLYVMENAKTEKLKTPVLCTFGSPRVGDATFVRVFNGLRLASTRFAVDQDLVPQLPPQAFGFRHVNALVDLNAAGKIRPGFACWHVMPTYLSLIDPALSPDPACAA